VIRCRSPGRRYDGGFATGATGPTWSRIRWRDTSAREGSTDIAILAGTVVLVVTSVRTDAITEAVDADELISVLIAIDLGDGRLVTEVFFHQPSTNRGALFDIPARTGVVLETLTRVDSVDAAFFENGASAYREEVAALLGEPIDYHIVLPADDLVALVDLVEGVRLFVADLPNDGPDAVLIPNGDVILDGEKTLLYASYSVGNE
jgi:anionic cell wall polymer biosynthesis LytR-Cps2A-Psr (LCP) family protein